MQPNIDVTAFGILSAVGYDARTACAALRAGISRPRALAGTHTLDLESAQTVPLIGHPVEPFTNGFVGVARWLQLLTRAFEDIERELPADPTGSFWQSVAVLVLVPDLQGGRFDHDERCTPARIQSTLIKPLCERLPASLPRKNVVLQPLDRLGLLYVIEAYDDLLRSMAVERVVVLAVDSYTCPFALNWLGENHKLKSDLNPVGVAPGECAVALLLEPAERASRRERRARAHIEAVARVQDSAVTAENAPLRGSKLADVMRPLLNDDVGDVYIDLNGETWRAQELGAALVALAPRGIAAARLHHLAANLGDTGCASLPLSTLVAARSLERGYSRGRAATCVASSETGEVGGLRLRKAEGN